MQRCMERCSSASEEMRRDIVRAQGCVHAKCVALCNDIIQSEVWIYGDVGTSRDARREIIVAMCIMCCVIF